MPFAKRAESRGIVSWAMSSSPQCVGWITRSAPAWRGRENGNTKRKRRLGVPGQAGPSPSSADHLIGAGQEVGREGGGGGGGARGLGCCEVHPPHDLVEPLRGHRGGPPPLGDLAPEVGGPPPSLDGVHLVPDESARLRELAIADGRQPLAHGEL